MLSRDWVARSGVEAHSADSGRIGAMRDAIAIVIGAPPAAKAPAGGISKPRLSRLRFRVSTSLPVERKANVLY